MSHFARFALAATAAVALVAGPASARDTDAAETKVQVETAGDAKKYCITNSVSGKEHVTGSVLSRKQCLTKEQWRKRGVDLDAR